MKIKGFAMKCIGEVGFVEKKRPQCNPLDAIVRPLAVSPCSSDVHTVYSGALGDRKDMILGHEAVGEIVEVGSLVKDFKVGDRVIVPAITPDWMDRASQNGFSMHSTGMLAGWKFSNFKDGVFAELFHVNEADGNLALLPQELSLKQAVMLCDMAPTGFHGVELADVQFGDTVCVIGIGPVGLMSVAGARLRGAGRIIVVGSRPNCIELAKVYGATDVVNYRNGDIVEQIMCLTAGKGVDKVVIAGGDNDTFKQAITILKAGGTIGNVNYLGEGEYISIPRIEWGCGMSHKTIKGGLMPGGRLRMEKLANMVVYGRVDTGLLITHEFQGMENLPKALELMRNKPKDLIKPIVYFTDQR